MRVIFFASLILLAASANAEIFRWTDASGKTVFGDHPPEAVKVDQVKLPLLTVADGYGKKEEKEPIAEAKSTDGDEGSSKSDGKQSSEASRKDKSASDETSAETDRAYTRFSVKSPIADEVVRANDGSLLVQLDIQPALKEGHGVVFYLDGKQVGSSLASAIRLDNIGRGAHSVFAVLHDAKKSVLTNTESVNFTVLRSAL